MWPRTATLAVPVLELSAFDVSEDSFLASVCSLNRKMEFCHQWWGIMPCLLCFYFHHGI